MVLVKEDFIKYQTTYTYIHTHTYIHACIHTYKLTYLHTYIHTWYPQDGGSRGDTEHCRSANQNSEYNRPKRKHEERNKEIICETLCTLINLFIKMEMMLEEGTKPKHRTDREISAMKTELNACRRNNNNNNNNNTHTRRGS